MKLNRLHKEARQLVRHPLRRVRFRDFMMAADERRNVVMTVTTPSNYKSILALLRELDTPVKQVLVEATIGELTLTGELSLGFEFFIKQKVKDGTLDISTLGNALNPLFPAAPSAAGGSRSSISLQPKGRGSAGRAANRQQDQYPFPSAADGFEQPGSDDPGGLGRADH